MLLIVELLVTFPVEHPLHVGHFARSLIVLLAVKTRTLVHRTALPVLVHLIVSPSPSFQLQPSIHFYGQQS